MNERIKELAHKAGLTSLTTKGLEDIVDGCYIVSPNKLELFSELMHDECIDAVPNDLDPATYFKVLQAIKNHFGF